MTHYTNYKCLCAHIAILFGHGPWLAQQRFPYILEQLFRTFIHTHHKPLGIIRLGIQIQHILHLRNEFTADLGNTLLLLLPWLEFVFLKSAVPFPA